MQGPWSLHLTLNLGAITDRWIDLQVRSTRRYPGRLLGLDVSPGAEVEPHWVQARQRRSESLAFQGMWRLDGVSTRLLARRFRTFPPALVHAHYGTIAASLRHVASALDRPLVATFYGYDATATEHTSRGKWQRRYARLFRQAGAILCEGPAMGRRIAALGCPEESIRVVRLPADEEGLSQIQRRMDDSFTVVIAGRWTAKKGFDTAIKAFARGVGERSDARLLIVGGGELEQEYKRLVRAEGIAERVEWGGRLAFREFMSTIGRGRVALYPSRTAPDGDSEGGAPVTLIESQWLGVPSLISDHDDLPFVTDDNASIVLSQTDCSQWAEALAHLYDNPAQLDQMSRHAAAFSRAHHSTSATARAREVVYDEVVNG